MPVQPPVPRSSFKPSPSDFDDDLPPPPRAMYQPTPRRSRASRDADSASDLGVSALGWFVLIDVVANLILYAYFLIGEPSQELRLQLFGWCQGLAAIGAISLALWGGIWLLCIAFADDIIQGILCLFVPFYTLFFALSRWNERRGAFGLTLAPLVMLLVSVVIGFAALGSEEGE